MRQQILNNIITDLTRLNKANGYNHDAPAASIYYSAPDDVSIAPHINIYCSAQLNEPVETGFESTLKINILTHVQADTDINKEGILTQDFEDWIYDYWRFFTHPSCPGSNVSQTSTLWNVDGVTYYYISAVEPYYDRNENRHTIFVELTVFLVIPA
jgi:hypothetical protein